MKKLKLGNRVELVEDYRDLKVGRKGLVVGDKGDNTSLVLFDDYHNGHNGNYYEDGTTYLKGYSHELLRKIDGGCWWVDESRLKVLPFLKSWKGGGK